MATVAVAVDRSGVADVVAELTAISTALGELPGRIVTEGADAASAAILDSVVATRGTLSMSGLGTSLGLTQPVISDGGETAEALIQGDPRHAWRFAAGTGPHTIRVGHPYAMPTPYGTERNPGGYYSVIQHPGARSVDLVGPAYVAADEAVDEVAETAGDEVLDG